MSQKSTRLKTVANRVVIIIALKFTRTHFTVVYILAIVKEVNDIFH